ncbi:disease resistance protein RPM1 isoform X1 [Ziziphus jujuba]|uniref:Disease resistance protein RPM1 isoform X1 n=1 Tax=Ziziphus jujuba TaxID=326968 RepID=A0ABM4A0Z3_ZIZJJ|nr:disease resistance protein RPM1 isoform X1 [Ziziphus jujuba]XP_060670400.1 disease resistance protein RPM1 isoform X1 [Ziziphus jujuba]
MMKDDECWLETTQVDIQLSCAIKKLEKVLDLEEEVLLRPTVRRKIAEIKKEAENLRNLTRHSRELFGGFDEYFYVGGEGNNPFDIFEKEVLNLAYQVEDATSSFLCRREMRKRRQKSLMKKMMVLFDFFSDQHDNMFKEIMKAKNEFISSSNFGSFDIDHPNSLFSDAYMLPREDTDYSKKFGRSNFVCCEEKRGGKNSPGYHSCGYLSILGKAGSGKTTFVRELYRAVTTDLKEKFEISAWVRVRPEYDITDIYTAIVHQQVHTDMRARVPDEIVDNLGSEKWSESVKKWLENSKFIIVLDDVHYIWSKIKSHLKDLFPIRTSQRSTVIMTSCEAQASEFTRVIKVLSPLDGENSRELFKNTLKKAKMMITQIDEQAEDDALNQRETERLKEIIGEIGSHLPLGIITLARLYMTHKHDNQKSSSPLSSLIDWDLKYQMLPPGIRQCYLYMGIFPENFEIPIRRLFRLWIAEGLLAVPDLQSSETPSLEDLALSYLMELESKQMISVNWKNGRPKTCCMLLDKHRFFSRKAMDLGIFHVHKGLEKSSSEFRVRLAEHADIKHYTPSADDYKLRSYISLNRKRDTPAQHVAGFLNNLAKNGFGLLRVLDLENVYKPLLPAETLEKLFFLTYLGLRWTFLDSLPDSVGTLQYLETLDVKHTNITILPSTIWKAKKLKHLYMNQVHFDISIKKGFTSSLANLQTLWGLSIGSSREVVKSLSKLRSLRKLGLTYHSTTAEEIANWISKLAYLQYLRLRSIDDVAEPSKLKLPADMSKLEKLSELYLVGDLSSTNLPQFPPNLKILTLTGSQLKNDSLRMLGKLSCLETLRFYGQSYSYDRIIFHKDEFSNLVVLKLWKLVQLETLEMKEGAMSKLQELDVRSCHNLKSMKGLEQVGGLQTITLADMRDEFLAVVESKVSKDRLVVTVLEQVGGLKTITLTNMPGEFVETVKREVNKVRVAVEVREQVGGLKKITLTIVPDDFVETVKRKANKDRVAVEVLDQVGGLPTISLKNTPDYFVETVKSEVNRVRVAVEVLKQVDGSQTITLITMPDDFVETVKREVKSKVNRDCLVVKVQNLKSSPISTNQSNNNMRGRGRGRNSGEGIVCQFCGLGYTVRDCSDRFNKNFSGNKNQDISSADYSSPDVVVNPELPLDSDATDHVTADQSNLQQKSKYGGMDKLIIGNEQGYEEGTSTWHT